MLYYIAYENLNHDTLTAFLQVAIELKGNKVAIWEYVDCDDVESTSTLSVKIPQALYSHCSYHKQLLERVTTYDDDDLYFLQDTYEIEPIFINEIVDSIISINTQVDSISIYREGEKEWFMCLIFHENMCIAKNIDSSEEAILTRYGLKYSYSPPKNW